MELRYDFLCKKDNDQQFRIIPFLYNDIVTDIKDGYNYTPIAGF
jgi:hypothetical protein